MIDLGTVGVEGAPAAWDPMVAPHVLVVGQSGAGKTYLLRSMTEELAEAGAVWIADGKAGGDFAAWRSDVFAAGPVEVARLVDAAAAEVERRNRELRSTGSWLWGGRPVFLVIDELAAIQLRRRGEDAKEVRERRELLQGALGEIALMGRSARVHLLVGLQRPDTDVLPGPVRDQLGVRIALGWLSADGYRMVYGVGDMAAPVVLAPGNGWISGHVGHRDGPRPFFVGSRGHR